MKENLLSFLIRMSIFLLFVFGVLYISPSSPDFPKPPAGSLQSNEPGDSEELFVRRAYFTNLNREEVISHYQREFGGGLRLNYPPEDAQVIIRDQTRSTYLEELVHPLRESLFINGFEPKEEKDKIIIGGVPFRQKIIVKYIPSSFLVRISIFVSSLALALSLIKEWFREIKMSCKWFLKIQN